MPTLRRLLRRLIGLDSADSGNLPTTDERVDQLTAELTKLRETLGTLERQKLFNGFSIVDTVGCVSARVYQLNTDLAQLRDSTCRAIAIHTSQIQDVSNELRKNDQTLGNQLESYNRNAIMRCVELRDRIEVLEKLAAATPSAIVNLKPSEN